MRILQMRMVLAMTSIMFLANCAANQAIIEQAQANISEEMFRNEVRTLGSDEFMGRKPGQPGGDKAVEYLSRRAKEVGLVPVMGSSYTQDVPMTFLSNGEDSKITLSSDAGNLTWLPNEHFLIGGRGKIDPIKLDYSDVIITGYGVVDSALNWNQYGDLDYEGKLVIIFRNDPGFINDDTTKFNGKENSPHAFFNAKWEAAEAAGAKGALVVYDIDMTDTGVGWEQISGNNGITALDTDEIEETPEFLTGFMSPKAATELLATRNLDYNDLLMSASEQLFEPISLGYSVNYDIVQKRAPFMSYNILGMIPGTTRPDEFVIYSAHWDGYGVDETLEGDQIFNGAADNGTGSASLLVLAESFLALEEGPKRSIIFLWDTGEESGLLGSAYYGDNPVVPLNQTVVNLNIDMLMPFGKMNDVTMTGYGKSDLEDYVEKAAGKLGMILVPDDEPEQNFYYRSDHINFARHGVPALDMGTGLDHVIYGADSTQARIEEWRVSTYHQLTDIYEESWDVEGIMDYLKISFDIGYTISNQKKWPKWNKDDEFYPVREASFKGETP